MATRLDQFIDALNHNLVMIPLKSVFGFECKGCGNQDEDADGMLMYGITKLLFLPHPLHHFRTEHSELDRKVDMAGERHDRLRALCQLELDANVKSSNGRPLAVVLPEPNTKPLSYIHTCGECGKTFGRTDGLRRHENSVHLTVSWHPRALPVTFTR